MIFLRHWGDCRPPPSTQLMVTAWERSRRPLSFLEVEDWKKRTGLTWGQLSVGHCFALLCFALLCPDGLGPRPKPEVSQRPQGPGLLPKSHGPRPGQGCKARYSASSSGTGSAPPPPQPPSAPELRTQLWLTSVPARMGPYRK